MSSSFLRWRWHTFEPVTVGSDLCDSDARDGLARWIDSSQPRLMIVSDVLRNLLCICGVGIRRRLRGELGVERDGRALLSSSTVFLTCNLFAETRQWLSFLLGRHGEFNPLLRA